MFAQDEYQLIDFGQSKKLERIGGVHVLRDSPSAQSFVPKLIGKEMPFPTISYDRKTRTWQNIKSLPEDWSVSYFSARFNLKPTPFGHIGLFPEQSVNWSWLGRLSSEQLSGLSAINLFAYTGGTTMALASKGVAVTHVDSAKNVVRWASGNAKASNLDNPRIRWIVEDAMKFVEREIKRGNRYDILVADPPAIGHAGNKMTWKIERDLERLIQLLGELAGNRPKLMLLTCHSIGFDATDLLQLTNRYFKTLSTGASEHGSMDLTAKDGRKLNCGCFFRWCLPELS